jgi:hypothetical protein
MAFVPQYGKRYTPEILLREAIEKFDYDLKSSVFALEH